MLLTNVASSLSSANTAGSESHSMEREEENNIKHELSKCIDVFKIINDVYICTPVKMGTRRSVNARDTISN